MSSKVTPRGYAKASMWAGIIATLGGNAAAADWSDPLGVVISAFPAAALALVFEMTTRGKAIPSRNRWRHKAMRLAPSLVIMAISAWCSYGHLYHVAAEHGQHGLGAYLMAALPDAMMLLSAAVLRDMPQTRTAVVRAAATVPARKTAKPKTAKPKTAPVAKTPAPRTVQVPVFTHWRPALMTS